MDTTDKEYNDRLMAVGYQILEKCIEKSIPCFLWGGGAIYHMLQGNLDYRKMSDLEFFLPKKYDKILQEILIQLDFIPYETFNNIQNMSRTPRREFYRPNRELTSNEIEEVKRGRKSNIENVDFQKIEIFVDGIRMCWTFNYKDLPSNYSNTLICPPGFQIALKANPIHPDDFDLKDIQDITNVMNSDCCTDVKENDTIFKSLNLGDTFEYSIGLESFKTLSSTKREFPSTVIKNLTEVLNYPELNEEGK
ncbi:MAG: hypothetical protein ACXADW_11485, partial [Candidatus Hodarchaeales archaeon]